MSRFNLRVFSTIHNFCCDDRNFNKFKMLFWEFSLTFYGKATSLNCSHYLGNCLNIWILSENTMTFAFQNFKLYLLNWPLRHVRGFQAHIIRPRPDSYKQFNNILQIIFIKNCSELGASNYPYSFLSSEPKSETVTSKARALGHLNWWNTKTSSPPLNVLTDSWACHVKN